MRTLVLPGENVAEAGLVSRARLAAPPTLRMLVEALRRGALSLAERPTRGCGSVASNDVDFGDVVGQATAKRALEVAAAGGHNILLVGPPGAGKTMLARRLPTILPDLTEDEALEVIAVRSVAGLVCNDDPVPPPRPFRAPHHTVSSAGLLGGGSNPRPGEVSLAHRGVLFLDEFLEFPRTVLDGLRQPMEDGRVVIARARSAVVYPARFTLVAATNPCPCGRAGDPRAHCTCPESTVTRYRSRLSGPLADRIDVHVTVGAVPLRALAARAPETTSSEMRERVRTARARQLRRFTDGVAGPGVTCNAHASGRWLESHSPITAEGRDLLHAAAERLSLSARGYHRVLKVARTIADLAGDEAVGAAAVAEALRYRPVAAGLAGGLPNGSVGAGAA